MCARMDKGKAVTAAAHKRTLGDAHPRPGARSMSTKASSTTRNATANVFARTLAEKASDLGMQVVPTAQAA